MYAPAVKICSHIKASGLYVPIVDTSISQLLPPRVVHRGCCFQKEGVSKTESPASRRESSGGGLQEGELTPPTPGEGL